MISWLMRILGVVLVAASTCSWAATDPARQPVLLVVGDSLSAAYGINVNSGWVHLLDQRLAQQGYEYRVVNASVSGETTSGARVRLPRLLQVNRPSVVVFELGANDGLRGLPLTQARKNLEEMIGLALQSQARVVLLGMRIPPNYGADYTNEFHSMYTDLASAHKVSLVPFLLDGVALNQTLMQADGLHPTAVAQPKLLENVWPVLQSVLKKNS